MLLNDGTLKQLFGIIVAILVIVYGYFKWSYQYWKRRNVPYLKPTVPLGNFSNLVGDIVSGFYKTAKTKGWKYCGLYFMFKPVLLVLDLDILKCILSKDFNHFVDRGTFVNEKDEPIGAHLFAVGGVRWKNLRLKFTPHFSAAKLRNTLEILISCGKTLESYLKEKLNPEEAVDVKHILACYTLDMIGSSAFGLECNNFKQIQNSPFRKYGRMIFEKTLLIKLKTNIANVFPELARALHFTIFPAKAKDFFTNLVTNAVKYREDNNFERNDFLQMMINLRNQRGENSDEFVGDGKDLTMKEIVAQCFIFFNAGYETSSTTMSFALYELAVHPEIQEKVREELFTVSKKYNDEITYQSLKELKFLEQVLNETLRKYPALPFVTRVCVKDYHVPDSDLVIEEGTQIFVPIKAIHYDADYYENPKRFDPDRFTEQMIKERNSYSHLPFGEGARMCIGARLGMMTSKIGVSTILKNFRVKLNKRTKLPFEFSMRSTIPVVKGGIWLNFDSL